MKSELNPNEIICAAATPPGKAALSLIRVSGPGAIELVSGMAISLRNISPGDARRLLRDYIIDNDGNPIDEVTLIPYFAPKSYTSEEMVEIICHGGFASTRVIIDRLIRLGVRPAEPGEFTKRAFLGGRISLSQAEAVAAAIEAKSELALKAAARNLKGELYRKIDDIRSTIRDLLALIEAEIDFSEDEIDKTPFDNIAGTMESELSKSNAILESYDFGRGLNSGYKIAIVGRANVGKSSLLNLLLRRDRAIVTDIPGTTRDTLTEWIDIDGFPILITDTAGLRESGDSVERIGQIRTREEIEKSDLALFMIDRTAGFTIEDKKIFAIFDDKPVIVLVNKIDLESEKPLDTSKVFPGQEVISISAITGAGLDSLKNAISSALHIDSFSLDSAVLATERQYRAMGKARDTLARGLEELRANRSGEIVSVFLRETLDHLGELVGETTADDILNKIFARFCVGK